MQEQGTLQQEPTGTTSTAADRAQAGGSLKQRRIFLGAVAGLALVVASIFGVQALIDEEPASETQQVSPGTLVQEDPPLPDGWIDPYFSQPASIPVQEDPPLPDGWVDPYFQGQD